MSAPQPPIFYRRLKLHYEVANDCGPVVTLTSPENVADFCTALTRDPQEVMLWIGLDSRKHVIAVQEVFRGTVDSCSVHPRDVFRSALVLASTVAGVILVHNHPSGCCDPSDEDLEFFDTVTEAGELLKIPVIDCLVIARDGAWSRAEDGRIKRPEGYNKELIEPATIASSGWSE